ncbi:MAG: cysteine--tRNA ligase [Candidatus Pacebacteria bacterium]|nr:cysteine--tRNA ligase [Candidatus Paceibacterota bacterium]
MLKLYNTLTRKKEEFRPIKPETAGIYACGPTVYWFAHVGNFRTYFFEDILKRVLLYNNYAVKHVMNITDVGHLTSDADTGEDKLEKGAQRENKTAWEVADFYTRHFQNDLKSLNIQEPAIWVKATDTIKEQIDLIKTLEQKGFTYQISDGVYFDTSKLKNYGALWGNKKPAELKAGARVEMMEGKKHPSDFALWKLTPSGVKRQMEWDSPWGRGFPGWHTECVVMSINNLGIPFDIHCGGIDHIQIHHTNEIAQAQGAYGKMMANYWMHGEFLNIEGGKISKSAGNIITLEKLAQKGLSPLSLRYLFLTAHYKAKLDFSWKSLEASQNALQNLRAKILQFKADRTPENVIKADGPARSDSHSDAGGPLAAYRKKFLEFINDDLNMPKALALMWQAINDPDMAGKEKYSLILDMDKIFALDLDKIEAENIPPKILSLAEEREKCRQAKDWQGADKIRAEIEKQGFRIEDMADGPLVKKA